jgi:hypothetical protein
MYAQEDRLGKSVFPRETDLGESVFPRETDLPPSPTHRHVQESDNWRLPGSAFDAN